MGNTNTKPDKSLSNPIKSLEAVTSHQEELSNQFTIPKYSLKSDIITDYQNLKRQNTLLSKLKPLESQITPGISFKPKKFDTEKFKIANQPYLYYI